MRNSGAWRSRGATAALGSLLAVMAILTACEGARHGTGTGGKGAPTRPAATMDPTRIPGVGDRWQRRIPADSRQVVAVYGEGKDAANSTVVLYMRQGSTWESTRSWPAHNGKKGWTTDHREGDNRSPVGVFTLSDAGGVLKDPGSRLPYTRSAAFAAPRWWAKSYWHDFDFVIAIDYNRVKGTPPNDPTRPEGEAKGGGIWLHMDHGSGTSACVSLSESAMEYLLRTLDPDRHPVVVMGDRADLKRSH
ncbi:L,D-peptidoglycan transpeptidase YkuD, ErfK/YbiS/YcfS/YnhG family [Streptomyces sp. cf386]|uniref:L,D-transpeptidase family protein n=1 Tax=Streptomyces sp. cf386 TaxID=1761904 RepID=UPI00088D7334|nr:L,D-transpeptidase family protein [Streptomyces sp. cf386]SDM41125.1 L,D-peptidoglycan transpeptidase YkuD, ErfK/YbiS/YcfS/YnhG family [Streptomyces sp. cf386]